MKKKWVPFTALPFAAETPFRARAKAGDEPQLVVFNQFGQLLTADTRRIVSDQFGEMEVEEAEAAPAKPASPPAAPAKA